MTSDACHLFTSGLWMHNVLKCNGAFSDKITACVIVQTLSNSSYFRASLESAIIRKAPLSCHLLGPVPISIIVQPGKHEKVPERHPNPTFHWSGLLKNISLCKIQVPCFFLVGKLRNNNVAAFKDVSLVDCTWKKISQTFILVMSIFKADVHSCIPVHSPNGRAVA